MLYYSDFVHRGRCNSFDFIHFKGFLLDLILVRFFIVLLSAILCLWHLVPTFLYVRFVLHNEALVLFSAFSPGLCVHLGLLVSSHHFHLHLVFPFTMRVVRFVCSLLRVSTFTPSSDGSNTMLETPENNQS